tara:strand:+ start:5112 stop:5687 length:576 start_codon:yes stop_codon:yes gene_type:complete
MPNGTALWKDDDWNPGWGRLAVARNGVLTLTTSDGIASADLNLGGSAFVDVFATEHWLAAVGHAASELVIGHREGPRVDVAANLPRLERTGTGLDAHAARFHPRPHHDQCVLAWEIGVALIDPWAGVVWSFVHDDVDQRLLSVGECAVELVGLRRSFSVMLADGAATAEALPENSDVDVETVAEWRRSIGR